MIYKAEITNLLNYLKAFNGNKYLSLVTNNNGTDQSINLSPLKYDDKNIVLQIIMYNDSEISVLDSFKEISFKGILIDTEVKNSKIDFTRIAEKKFPDSKIIKYGSNEITSLAFELFFSAKASTKEVYEAAVYGAGNLGTIIAAKLANRGILVNLVTTKHDLYQAYSHIGKYYANYKNIRIMNYKDDFSNSDLHIGCTSGIQVIQKNFIEKKISSNTLIDVGGNNFTEKAHIFATQNKNFIYYLSIDEALLGWLETFTRVESSINSKDFHRFDCGHIFVPRGRLLSDGDILVDYLPNPTRVFGRFNKSTGQLEKYHCDCQNFFKSSGN